MSLADVGAICAILLIVSPLAAAIIAFVAPRLAAVAAGLNSLLMTVAAFVVLNAVADTPIRHAIGGWGAPLGIDLYADPLTGVMVTTTALVVLAVTLYAPDYLARTDIGIRLWPLLLFMHAALNALSLSADIFNLYVALELLSLAAVALVALADKRAAIAAALRYLLASLVASMAYLLGVAFLYHSSGVLDLAALAEHAPAGAATWAALGLMTAGLVVKGALFPVHFWLPRAHSDAPTPVSALLSGLVVKAPFYVLLRLWYAPFEDAPHAVGLLLGLLGVTAILWGSVQALRQERLKLLVAYSTVAQIGYLYLLFPLIESRRAIEAVTVLILAHALSKAAMFLAAGNIQHCLGHDRIRQLHRVAKSLPLTLAAFGVSGACIMGIPPSGNFIAKWLLIEAAFEGGEWGWAVIVVLGSLLSAAYVFRVVGHAFTLDEAFEGTAQISTRMAWSPFILSLLALMLGLFAAPLLDLIGPPAAGSLASTESTP